MGTKIFNSRPSYIKKICVILLNSSNRSVKNFLYLNCFYILGEYFNCNNV
jgi:hypothetical protein